MDGKSLLSLIRDKNAEWREYIDIEHSRIYDRGNYWCALTDGKIKYIWNFSTGKEQLFDLLNDPDELFNLSDNRKYRNEIEKWRKRMIGHLSERGDEFVNDGKLVIREKSLLHSPFYQTDDMENNKRVSWWRNIYKGF